MYGMKNQNIDHSRYKVIPRVLIFVFQGERVLLIRDAQGKKWQGKLNALGGHVEQGEDILVAAKRELQEEAGIIGINLHFVGSISIDVEPEIGISLFLFKGKALTADVKSGSEGIVSWVRIDEIDHHDVLDDLRELLPMVDQWKDGDPMIIGHYQYHQQKEVRKFSRA
jgi:8-oxo-dGTP diphosphatase